MRGADGARIWYQSFTDPDPDGGVFHAARELSALARRPGGVRPRCSASSRASAPASAHRIPLRGTGDRHTLTAQEQGYDAFVIGHFQEAGLAEARAAVRIPVIGIGIGIGIGEATMLHACTLQTARESKYSCIWSYSSDLEGSAAIMTPLCLA
jgi:hypothetical protein